MHPSSFGLPLLFVLTFLAACSEPEGDTARIEYVCGSVRFAVEYDGDIAVVSGPRGFLRLPLAISASGARYSDGSHTYWEHQGTARFEFPDTTYQDCRPSLA